LSTLAVLFFTLIANTIHSFLPIIQEIDDMEGKIEKKNSETLSETQWESRPDNFKTISFQFHENYDAIQNHHDTCD
jgi:hypothetical protein